MTRDEIIAEAKPKMAESDHPADEDLEALRKSVAEYGVISEALHEICKHALDLTLTVLTTDGVMLDIRQRAYAVHRIIVHHRKKYDLRSRGEVERGQRDPAIDFPNYLAFGGTIKREPAAAFTPVEDEPEWKAVQNGEGAWIAQKRTGEWVSFRHYPALCKDTVADWNAKAKAAKGIQ